MPEIIENTITPPEWLDTAFLESKLRQGLKKENLKIIKNDMKPAVAVGDNYSSCIFRAKLTIEENTTYNKNIIVKSLPKSDRFVEHIREYKFFLNEADMLMNIMPKIHKILSKVGNFSVMCADAFYYQDQPNELLIMEDLCESGFAGANRFEGLSVDHCVLVMETIASIHAASLKLFQQEPSLIEKYSNGFWESSSTASKMYSDGLQAGIDKLESLSKFDYAEKLKKIADEFPDSVLKAVKRDDSTLNVLNHGDMWTNNMMFKLEKDKPTAIKFVDLQLAHYDSPTIDLIYFLFISPRNDVRINKLDFLLETYHKKLTNVTQALDIKIDYSLDDLKKDFKKRLAFGLGVTLTVFPLTSAPPKDALKIDEVSEEKSGFTSDNNMYNSPRFEEGFVDVVKYLDENAII